MRWVALHAAESISVMLLQCGGQRGFPDAEERAGFGTSPTSVCACEASSPRLGTGLVGEPGALAGGNACGM
jgi:hypothetical protein